MKDDFTFEKPELSNREISALRAVKDSPSDVVVPLQRDLPVIVDRHKPLQA
jgi:hypothetical protein